jgi:hypothetical protein
MAADSPPARKWIKGRGFMKRSFLFLGALCLLVISYSGAWATLFEGIISTDTKTLIGHQPWDSVVSKVSWNVDNESSQAGLWKYFYSFTFSDNPNAPSINLTRIILELSTDAGYSNIDTVYGTPDINTYNIGAIDLADFDGLPGTMYGLDLSLKDNQAASYTWTILSDRAPMWGDLILSGNTADQKYFYNYRFGQDSSEPISDGNAGGWVLVPNSVPESSTMLLLGFGLMGMAFIGRRKIFR